MNVVDKLHALQNCELLAAAPEEALLALSQVAEIEHYAPEEVVFEAGESSSRVFVVVQGTLEVRLSADTEMVSFYEAGALFGEYAMFANGVRTAQVAAREGVIVLSIDAEDFRSFLLRSPETILSLLQTAVRRLQRAERRKV